MKINVSEIALITIVILVFSIALFSVVEDIHNLMHSGRQCERFLCFNCDTVVKGTHRGHGLYYCANHDSIAYGYLGGAIRKFSGFMKFLAWLALLVCIWQSCSWVKCKVSRKK